MKYQNIDDEGLVPMIFHHERKPFSSRAQAFFITSVDLYLHERRFVPSRGDIALLRPAGAEVCLSSTIIGILFLLNPGNSRPRRKLPHRRKDLKDYLQPHCLPRLGATK